jgi:pimeloyl-ACP methyl ester carboxylesterase
MTEWFSGDVIANGIGIHYYRTGGNKPPLVLNHGATDDGLCWVRLAKVLEPDYDVIMPDARGHGLSEAPESGYNSDDRAADLAGFIEALKLEKPAIGGHSMGANTSFYAAANYPGLVRCAILEDPAFRSETDPPASGDRTARMRQQMAERKAMTREAIMAKGRADNPTWSEEEFGPWADAKQRVSLNFTSGVRAPERKTWQELLPTVSCPLLLVTADPDKGGIVTPEVAEEAVRLQPKLKVVRLRGAGHNVRREQFDGFVEAVRAFLSETAG